MESLAFSISATSRMGGLGEYRVRMGTVGTVGGLGAMDAIDVKGVYLQLGLGASSWWQSKCLALPLLMHRPHCSQTPFVIGHKLW